MAPTTVCKVRGQSRRCRRGKKRARRIGFGLQPVLQPLAHPFSAFAQYFCCDGF
jgi:hypothetical protein